MSPCSCCWVLPLQFTPSSTKLQASSGSRVGIVEADPEHAPHSTALVSKKLRRVVRKSQR